MLVRSFKRQAFVTPLYSRRCYTALGPFTLRTSRGLRISAAGGGALTVSLIFGWGYSLHADAAPPSMDRALAPLHKLVTSYVVYSMCSVPGLVDASPGLLAVCTSIPGLRQLTEAFVRATFFAQVRSHMLPT
jgi:proline dehydrogenase